jgi:hypothetical protein
MPGYAQVPVEQIDGLIKLLAATIHLAACGERARHHSQPFR